MLQDPAVKKPLEVFQGIRWDMQSTWTTRSGNLTLGIVRVNIPRYGDQVSELAVETP